MVKQSKFTAGFLVISATLWLYSDDTNLDNFFDQIDLADTIHSHFSLTTTGYGIGPNTPGPMPWNEQES